MKFNLNKFRQDVSIHRLTCNKGKKLSYKDAGEQIGIGEITVYNIVHDNIKDPTITIILLCCKWMGKQIGEYVVRDGERVISLKYYQAS